MVCTGNKDRSPTAAMLIAEMCAPMWVTSAGTESWSKNPVNQELVEEADVICVMEEAHRRFIIERFRAPCTVVRGGSPRHPRQLRALGRDAGADSRARLRASLRDRQPAHPSRPSTVQRRLLQRGAALPRRRRACCQRDHRCRCESLPRALLDPPPRCRSCQPRRRSGFRSAPPRQSPRYPMSTTADRCRRPSLRNQRRSLRVIPRIPLKVSSVKPNSSCIALRV